ncbi:hypothetical protein JIN84_14785 [Luteolibacter yonseiensis]|uniref:Uncharacterized protein n=1 Tax=Luteolibacter yonseiensis TaxID=1144680 RepID=A0A934R878_9BACT|nr:hypothetical protein [Luteolibacter yonseiensis]MBK1816889.1 hypothetical protein [Luteolibacter yonseiensis]
MHVTPSQERMKKITLSVTLLGIIAGVCIGCNQLLVPLAGVFFGLLMISPLFLTLLISNSMVGTATQVVLLGSTLGYLTNLIYLIYFSSNPDNPMRLIYSVPVMIVLWFIAAYLGLTRSEIKRRQKRTS